MSVTHAVHKTVYQPTKPLLVWDGSCGFCRYWVTRWKRTTGDAVAYVPYEEVLPEIPDVSLGEFRQSVKLIEPDGTLYQGAEAALRSLSYGGRWGILYRIYITSGVFRQLIESIYRIVAANRGLLFRITKAMFGRDPERPRPYWLLYLIIGAVLLTLVLRRI